MLQLTETVSFWEDIDKDDDELTKTEKRKRKIQNNISFDDDNNTYTTDGIESVDTFEFDIDMDQLDGGRQYKQKLVACGDFTEDISDKLFEGVVDTGRQLSSLLLKGGYAKSTGNWMNRYFMSDKQRKQAKKDAIKRLDEEQQARELKTSREEVGGGFARLWRESDF